MATETSGKIGLIEVRNWGDGAAVSTVLPSGRRASVDVWFARPGKFLGKDAPEVNWGAYGSTNTEDALAYANLIIRAVHVAEHEADFPRKEE